MRITKSDILKHGLDMWMGKRVYFLSHNAYENSCIPVTGIITGYDEFQLFVENRYGLHHNKSDFFLSFEEMVDWIKNNIVTN